MGIFKSAQNFIATTFDQGTEVIGSVGKGVSIATTYIDDKSVELKLTQKNRIKLNTAKAMCEIEAELEADEKLAAMFEKLESEFA